MVSFILSLRESEVDRSFLMFKNITFMVLHSITLLVQSILPERKNARITKTKVERTRNNKGKEGEAKGK